MTPDDIYTARPGPELDALVHQRFGDGSVPVPPYSLDWELMFGLAIQYNIEFWAASVGPELTDWTMDLFHNRQYCRIGTSKSVKETPASEDQDKICAEMAARSLLKAYYYLPALFNSGANKE